MGFPTHSQIVELHSTAPQTAIRYPCSTIAGIAQAATGLVTDRAENQVGGLINVAAGGLDTDQTIEWIKGWISVTFPDLLHTPPLDTITGWAQAQAAGPGAALGPWLGAWKCWSILNAQDLLYTIKDKNLYQCNCGSCNTHINEIIEHWDLSAVNIAFGVASLGAYSAVKIMYDSFRIVTNLGKEELNRISSALITSAKNNGCTKAYACIFAITDVPTDKVEVKKALIDGISMIYSEDGAARLSNKWGFR